MRKIFPNGKTWNANLEKNDWIWNQCTTEDKARDCNWGL